MLKEEKRVTVTLGKREILLFSIALLITYGLVFAFGVEFGKSWMRSLLESQEIASTATPAIPKVQGPTVSNAPQSTQNVQKPAAPVIEVRPSVEKPAPPAPKVSEGGEPSVETPQNAASEVTSKAEEVKKEAKTEVEKAVSAAVSGAGKVKKKVENELKASVPAASQKAKSPAPKAKEAAEKAVKAKKPQVHLKKTTVKPHVVGGGYLVQVGAFSKESSAISLIKKLRAKGYHASMTPVKRGGKTFYKVFVGPYGSDTGARHALELLKKREGITGYLIAPKKK
jgi:cell division septation protein DedD